MKRINHLLLNAIGLIMIFNVLFSCSPKTEPNVEEIITVENSDPLPSWNEGKHKAAIIAYVEDVTNPSSANFIPVIDRIATFDNDGTLWSEKLLYFQLYFAIDRVKSMAADHPDWKVIYPFELK